MIDRKFIAFDELSYLVYFEQLNKLWLVVMLGIPFEISFQHDFKNAQLRNCILLNIKTVMNILIASMSSSTKTSSASILIGDYFIALANATGSLMTNLKLQKLVFYTQAWHIAVFNEAIFEEDFQAWVHGPVLPVLYDQYKHHQWRPIERTDLNEESMSEIGQVLVPSVKEILADVIEEYFHLDAYALEKSTHREDPWLIARNGLAPDEPSTNIVDKDDLLNYYSRFVKRNG